MSIATELSPAVFAGRRPGATAPRRGLVAGKPHAVRVRVPQTGRVIVPSPRPGVRLTRRGVIALWVSTIVVAVGLLAFAYASWQPEPRSATGGASLATVRVEPGDTLWSIAGRVAPQRDPRNVVDDLRRMNDLGSADLVPGEVLRLS